MRGELLAIVGMAAETNRLADALRVPLDAALGADLARLGTAAPALDLLSMRHETQYTRLFRS